MPANLSPEYKKAESQFRYARDPVERLDALKEMLRAIPKHKGTEHLQADIKSRIKDLTEELAGPRKTGARTGPPTVVKPEGAGQVALLGPPNSGKSALHVRLTGSHSQVGEYPFTTQFPVPGMMPIDDITVQLVDLPPIATEHPVPWIGNALQPADACLLVVDLSLPGCVEQVIVLLELLAVRKVVLTGDWPADGVTADGDGEFDPFTIVLPTLLIAAKADRLSDAGDELEVLEDLAGISYPCLAVSAESGQGLDDLGAWLFEHLGIVRVYTKIPGQEPDLNRPYTVRRGDTVHDVALLVHREIAADFKYARLWGGGEFDAQQVGRDHAVADGDVVELRS